MTNIQFFISIVILFMIRYSLDVQFFDWVADKRSLREEGIEQVYDEEEDDEPVDYYSPYDQRIDKLRAEIEIYNQSPSNADEGHGVYNVPHDEIKLEVDLEPVIEEEQELGAQEVAR